MKASELMIGDWVNIGGDLPKYSRVTELKRYDIQVCNYWIDAKCITPIPLTPEILKKNGWNGDYSSTYPLFDGFQDDSDGYLEISVFEDGEIRATINLCEYDLFPIKYVHELQHALRLCGLNELADNFKV